LTNGKQPNLRIPGPVPLPDDVLEVVGSQMINHRGPEYADMLDRMTANLRTVFMTKNDAYFITSSGTGGMEAAVVNTISPGDPVLALSIGVFGDRFTEIAEAFGGKVTKLEFPLGKPADPHKVREALRKLPGCKAVILTHNESSTGVANPLEHLCKVIHEESDALILVDAVSSGGGMAIAVDAWGIDVVATASQKSWVAPPGIAMITFSKKAWAAYAKSKTPKYYFDVKQYEDYLKIGQPPFTPALSVMYALEKSLEAMVAEGVENIFARHHEIAEHTRHGARSLGLEVLPEDKYASDTVTAIKLPADIDGKEFLSRVRKDYNVILGGGQKSLTGKIFRIGHMGWVEKAHIDEALEAAGRTLKAMRG
jgi:aspartate aminotransferase-like enzyme